MKITFLLEIWLIRREPSNENQNALDFEEIFSESDIQYHSKLRKQTTHDIQGRGLALANNVLW